MAIPWFLVIPTGLLLALMLLRSLLIRDSIPISPNRQRITPAEARQEAKIRAKPRLELVGGALAAALLAVMVGVVIGGSIVLGSVAWLS